MDGHLLSCQGRALLVSSVSHLEQPCQDLSSMEGSVTEEKSLIDHPRMCEDHQWFASLDRAEQLLPH